MTKSNYTEIALSVAGGSLASVATTIAWNSGANALLNTGLFALGSFTVTPLYLLAALAIPAAFYIMSNDKNLGNHVLVLGASALTTLALGYDFAPNGWFWGSLAVSGVAGNLAGAWFGRRIQSGPAVS